jgi:hypothetical protein
MLGCMRCGGQMLYDTLTHEWDCIQCGNTRDVRQIVRGRFIPSNLRGNWGHAYTHVDGKRMELSPCRKQAVFTH